MRFKMRIQTIFNQIRVDGMNIIQDGVLSGAISCVIEEIPLVNLREMLANA